MGEVVQSLKIVQHVTSDSGLSGERDGQSESSASVSHRSFNPMWNFGKGSTAFESDGTSSIFSSGPYSGLAGVESENLSRTTVISEDLHEGR